MAKTTLTPQQRHDYRDGIQRVEAAAAAALAAPDAADRAVELALRSPRLMRLSIRNLFIVEAQAMVRGIDLRDIDTYRGWKDRGRQVRRGQKALSMVVPMTGRRRDSRTNTDTDRDTEGDTDTRTDTRARTVTRFRHSARWFDYSQTDPVDNGAEGDHGDHGDEAAEAVDEAPTYDELYAHLVDQCARVGAGAVQMHPADPEDIDAFLDTEHGQLHVYRPRSGDHTVAIVHRIAECLARHMAAYAPQG